MQNERQLKEKQLLKETGFMSIRNLSEAMGVSEMTVRRDVKVLLEDPLFAQVYGGIIFKGAPANSYEVSLEISKNNALKQLIAKEAISFINAEDVIFLDSGTTVNLICQEISPDFSFTAISSNFEALRILAGYENCTVITPGGRYHRKPGMFYDSDSPSILARYRGNIGFLGTTGYDISMGLTCSYQEDVPLKKAILKACKTNVLVTDSSKFGRVSACSFADITQFSYVITDSGIPAEYIDDLKRKGVQLVIVEYK